MAQRVDLTNWLTHFIHDRVPEDRPAHEDGEPYSVPLCFDTAGKPQFASDIEFYDREYPLEPDASAFAVLKKILFDGHIRAGWSFRSRKGGDPDPTIYGPRSAVCFTEMPLYALLEYAKARQKYVGTCAIALHRSELFAAGARPVIYGLSGEHHEAAPGDPYFEKGLRCLASDCGLGLAEQYRYVATSFGEASARWIDWTHEREWRWPLSPGFDPMCPGLSLWLQEPHIAFSRILVLVPSKDDAQQILDGLKEYHDSGSNNYDVPFHTEALLRTSVLSLDSIADLSSSVRIDDLPLLSLPAVKIPIPSQAVLAQVDEAVKAAHAAATQAFEAAGGDADSGGFFGFASVVTYASQTEVTQALLDLGHAHSIGGVGYVVGGATKGICPPMLGTAEAAAKAAADVLTQSLGQAFFVRSRAD